MCLSSIIFLECKGKQILMEDSNYNVIITCILRPQTTSVLAKQGGKKEWGKVKGCYKIILNIYNFCIHPTMNYDVHTILWVVTAGNRGDHDQYHLLATCLQANTVVYHVKDVILLKRVPNGWWQMHNVWVIKDVKRLNSVLGIPVWKGKLNKWAWIYLVGQHGLTFGTPRSDMNIIVSLHRKQKWKR